MISAWEWSVSGVGEESITGFGNLPGVRLTALCDVDLEVLEQGVEKYSQPGQKLKAYSDYRRMLEDKDIDLISIATPNHTHALISVAAIQAGKDVYVEKPVSHNPWEGQQMVNAAREVWQDGSNRHPMSFESRHAGGGCLHSKGGLGQVRVARGLCYKRRPSIGKVNGPQAVPKHVDFDLWTGPAPLKPLMREKLHYDWHQSTRHRQWRPGQPGNSSNGYCSMDPGRKPTFPSGDQCRRSTGL